MMTDFEVILADRLSAFLENPSILETIINNRFLMILFVIVLLKIKYATYSGLWLSALINIPGTVLHETMHFVVGLSLNAHPVSFNLLPRANENGEYVMGSVGFRHITFYNALPSAMAPLTLLPLGYYLNRWYFQNIDITLINYLFYLLLQTILIENAVPSTTDFKVAFSHPIGLLFYAAVFSALLCMTL